MKEVTAKPCKGCGIIITADSPFDYCGECQPFPAYDVSVTYSEGDRVFFRETLCELTKCYDTHGESMLIFIPVKEGSPKEGEE